MESVESVVQNQYKNFVKDVIEDRIVSIHETIKKNSLALLKARFRRRTSHEPNRIRIETDPKIINTG